MKDLQSQYTADPRKEPSALAKIFGDFLKRQSSSCGEIIESIGTKTVAARNDGDSFITLDEQELAALKANPHLYQGNEACLVLENNHLYLAREYRAEVNLARAIAQQLRAPAPADIPDEETIKKAFDELNVREHDTHQLAAVRNCLSSNFSIITGGPGTGKTTIIAALVALEKERDPNIIIKIAAPTGKAAELLTQGLAATKHPLAAQTVHRLFRARPGTGEFGINALSPLECDLLIVDECSMLSLDTASKIFAGLKPETRVVLSGDHRQLEAIGSGAVLCSLLCFKSDGTPGAKRLKEAGVELFANFRARSAPVIQQLAKDIRQEALSDEEICKKIVSSSSLDYSFAEGKEFTAPVLEAVKKYWSKLPELASDPANVEKAFDLLKSFRVVTAARNGKEGCEALNTKILETLGIKTLHHPGSALLITENCRRTGLSNGDVGIVFEDKESENIKVFFHNRPEPLAVYDLPPHESAFAMTVHKAQGSGFSEVFFPLPQKETPLLTRELFYTALTRAAKKIAIYGSSKMVLAALGKQSSRATALAERILTELNK